MIAICIIFGVAVYLLGVANGGVTQAKAFDAYLDKRGLKQDYFVYLNETKTLPED